MRSPAVRTGSGRCLFLLLLVTLTGPTVGPCLALTDPPPLVIPFGPLLPPTDGWQQEVPIYAVSVASAGNSHWLVATGEASPDGEGRVTVRMMDLSGAGPSPEPLTVARERVTVTHQGATFLRTARGEGGAWVIWSSANGLRAQWIRADSGQALGEPLLLAAAGADFSLEAVGEGSTAWVSWSGNAGTHVRTLRVGPDGPEIAGTGPVAGSSSSLSLAVRGDACLSVRQIIDTGTVEAQLIGKQAEALGAPVILPLPGLASDDIYGLVNYGLERRMLVWARWAPPLSGRILYGRVLEADGRPAPGSEEVLGVEPTQGQVRHAVCSGAAGGFVILATEGGYGVAMRLEPASPIRSSWGVYLGNRASASTSDPAGDRLAIIATTEQSGAYRHTIQEFTGSLALPPVTVTVGTGVQEEPALDFASGAVLAVWQQKPADFVSPEVRLRRYGADGRISGPDQDVMPAVPGGLRYSSPAVAVSGGRMLIVAREDHSQVTNGGDLSQTDPDDVAGVLLTTDGVRLRGPFRIGYGLGSQRAARVAALDSGFCVVWREVLEIPAVQRTWETRIRYAILDRDGNPTVNGGTTLTSSGIEELSSPAIASSAGTVTVSWRRGGRVECAAIQYGYAMAPTVLFPDAYQARSPAVSGNGTVAARIDAGGMEDLIAASDCRGTPLGILTPPGKAGREPAVASLPDGDAVFWLNHRKSNAASTEIWMAVRQNGQAFGPAGIIQTGIFERDTLIARGDGSGRVMLAVKSLALGDTGVRFYLLAPGVSGLPVLTIHPAADGLTLDWTPSVLFPAASATVEVSPDLAGWSPLAAGSPAVTAAPDGLARLRILPAPAQPDGFFRLRASIAE